MDSPTIISHDIGLLADFTRSYEAFLRGTQEEQPDALDFPELTRREIIACMNAAHSRATRRRVVSG